MKPWERLLLFSLLFGIEGKVGHSETMLGAISNTIAAQASMLLVIAAAYVFLRKEGK